MILLQKLINIVKLVFLQIVYVLSFVSVSSLRQKLSTCISDEGSSSNLLFCMRVYDNDVFISLDRK